MIKESNYRRKAYRKLPVCPCGEWRSLQVHHIDGNHNNNALKNLKWLCEKCHAEEHGIKIRKKVAHRVNRKYKKGTSKKKRK